MAYDEHLEARILDSLPPSVQPTTKRMFGGLCFLDRGNMMCGIVGDRLMLRLSKELAHVYLGEAHTAAMDFTGRPMPSMMYVEPEGMAEDDQLRMWLQRAADFTATLPAR